MMSKNIDHTGTFLNVIEGKLWDYQYFQNKSTSMQIQMQQSATEFRQPFRLTIFKSNALYTGARKPVKSESI